VPRAAGSLLNTRRTGNGRAASCCGCFDNSDVGMLAVCAAHAASLLTAGFPNHAGSCASPQEFHGAPQRGTGGFRLAVRTGSRLDRYSTAVLPLPLRVGGFVAGAFRYA
jgi:hypothetical protein